MKRCLDSGAREAREEARARGGARGAARTPARREPSFSGCEPKSSPHLLPSTHASSRHVHTSVSQSVSSRSPRAHRLKGRLRSPRSTQVPVLSTRSLGLQPTPRCRPSSVNLKTLKCSRSENELSEQTPTLARARILHVHVYKKILHLAAAGVSRLYEKPRSMKSAQHWAVATRSRTNRFSSFDKLWWRSVKPH